MKTQTDNPDTVFTVGDLGPTEAVRITVSGEFIWNPNFDALIEHVVYKNSPATVHLLKALRRSHAQIETENKWRKLALQFDAQRMSALAHLRMMVQDPVKHIDAAREFLAAPPETKAPVEKLNPGTRLDVEGQAQHDTRDDGWIEWHGGDCPVDPQTLVEVRFKNYTVRKNIGGPLPWSDVIKYRVVK